MNPFTSYGILLIGLVILQLHSSLAQNQNPLTLSNNSSTEVLQKLRTSRQDSTSGSTHGIYVPYDSYTIQLPTRPFQPQLSNLYTSNNGIGGQGSSGLSATSIASLNVACAVCPSDQTYAQKCCSFGYQQCCNRYYQNQYNPQQYPNFAQGNNGYSNPNSWRPSLDSGTGGIIYNTQYSSAGNGLYSNSNEKPGSCYQTAYQNPSTGGGYNNHPNTGGYQYYRPSGFGNSGGYLPGAGYGPPGLGGNTATPYNQRQSCRFDYECIGSLKCCSGVCYNPSSLFG